jgi:hypothetical protein
MLLALVFFVAAAVCWAQAREVRRVAVVHEHLATLDYEVEAGIDDDATITAGPRSWPTTSLGDDMERQRATVSYWQAQYRQLMRVLPSASGNAAAATNDPAIMLVAANAAFRVSQADTSDRPATIERLDRVIQAYADVLRVAPENDDAAYNYEYVSRFRDGFARSRPGRAASEQKAVAAAEPASDLPAGPTLHGHPGYPPPETSSGRFRIITPMRFDEREESTPGRGAAPRRKG